MLPTRAPLYLPKGENIKDRDFAGNAVRGITSTVWHARRDVRRAGRNESEDFLAGEIKRAAEEEIVRTYYVKN